MTWPTRRTLCTPILLAFVLGACTASTAPVPPPSETEVGLVLASGEACATGCDARTPLMAGATEYYLMNGAFDVEALTARSSNPAVAYAVVEDVPLCPVGDWRLVPTHDPATCDRHVVYGPMLTVRTGAPGVAEVTLHDPSRNGEVVGRLPVTAEAPDRIVAVPDFIGDGDAYMPIRAIAIPVGAPVRLRLDVWAGKDGHRLHASSGIGALSIDTFVVSLGESDEPNQVELGDHITLTGRHPGVTALWLYAPDLRETVEVSVIGECGTQDCATGPWTCAGPDCWWGDLLESGVPWVAKPAPEACPHCADATRP